MARGFLRWSIAELADKAGVGISTVQRIEAEDGAPVIEGGLEWRANARDQTISAVYQALIQVGVTFLPDDGDGVGIRVKGKTRRIGPRLRSGQKTGPKASEMAGRAIDRVDDQRATAEDRARRKRRLLQGPKEFRDLRGDLPKPKKS
jgi:transcriptional regulator with XRE-family HTH domain